MNTFKRFGTVAGIVWVAFVVFLIVAPTVFWVWNLTKFIGCDFKEPYKEEVIYGLGVVVPPAAIVTVWYNKEK